ncbi:MAG: methyltransferase domain-containing protein [Actinomycetota bacterium]|nr:methyltransferase domain-containing protein [Actinomycetota bacterium]
MISYGPGHDHSVLRSHRWRTAQNSCAYLLPHLRPGLAVLDVGCGPGSITLDLAALVGPAGTVVGVDSAAAALEAAAGAAASRSTSNVTFALGDAGRLQYPDGSFDVVHAHQVLQHVADPVAVLAEMRRVTRPGGLVAARDADYGPWTWFPADPDLDAWLALYRNLAYRDGAEPDAGRRLLSWARSASGAGFASSAAFVDVRASASVWCYASPDDRAWWGGMWADRVVDSTFAGRALASGLATQDDLRRMRAAWLRWSAADDGWFAVLHGEVLCRVTGRPEEPARSRPGPDHRAGR